MFSFLVEVKKCIIKSTPNGMLFSISVYCSISAINALNGKSSISLCKVISGENTFSSELKGKSYKAIIGFFYEPSDNPFSFGSGYFIAFQATYLQEASSFVIIGASLTGIIENKFVKLK